MRIPTTMTGTITTMTEPVRLVRLMTMLSPAFPVGAFSYSHGLEQAIADQAVMNRVALEDWLTALVRHGSGWNDAVLFAVAFRTCDDNESLHELAQLAKALSGSKERQLETLSLGRAFVAAAKDFGAEAGGLDGPDMAYPVAVGAICGREGFALQDALGAYLQAFTSNLVAVAQRLVPMGQQDAVKAIAALEPVIAEVTECAARATLDDLGGASFASDIASMRHEALQPRIFRT